MVKVVPICTTKNWIEPAVPWETRFPKTSRNIFSRLSAKFFWTPLTVWRILFFLNTNLSNRKIAKVDLAIRIHTYFNNTHTTRGYLFYVLFCLFFISLSKRYICPSWEIFRIFFHSFIFTCKGPGVSRFVSFKVCIFFTPLVGRQYAFFNLYAFYPKEEEK